MTQKMPHTLSTLEHYEGQITPVQARALLSAVRSERRHPTASHPAYAAMLAYNQLRDAVDAASVVELNSPAGLAVLRLAPTELLSDALSYSVAYKAMEDRGLFMALMDEIQRRSYSAPNLGYESTIRIKG